MDSTSQSIPHQTSLSSQGYTHSMQSGMWSGNKVTQNNSNVHNIDPYSQQVNHYYSSPYSAQNPNDMNRYLSSASKDQNSNSTVYSAQHPMSMQSNYSCGSPSPNYPMAMKNNCNNMYYRNINSSKSYPMNSVTQPKKYPSSSLGLSQAPQVIPQSTTLSRSGTPMPQMPNFRDQNNYVQNMYSSNCNVPTSGESQSYMTRQGTPSSSIMPSQDITSIHNASLLSTHQISQVSSIPTPPETSSLPADGISIVETVIADGSADNIKVNVSSSSFVLPGSNIGHPASLIGVSSAMSSRNSNVSLQPPANLDEGSQASSASASSSIPDEQNSIKNNSKPNFSYPPTPNTLSSPGAASMSSFHDDLECISSPGWPKTPASPVANSSYEFANIKRPENLLKLYTLTDEPDRRYFLDKLIVFNEDRGSPITQCPTISKQPLDVFRVYHAVKERGGFVEVTNAKKWKDIAGAIGVGASSSAAYTLRKQYMKLLLPFECKYDRGGIDPQPIINMVEASSRKKGKNAVGAYGNVNHYNQGHPQAVDRYHANYAQSYQSSRYPTNNMDYQCLSKSVHYPQTATPNPVPNRNQCSQYSHSHNSVSSYGYYQGNNSASNPAFINNVPINSCNNVSRYGNNNPSSAVPQEQGFYAQQYSTPQQGQVQENSFAPNASCSPHVNFSTPLTREIPNDHSQVATFSKVNETVNATAVTTAENVSHQKEAQDNFRDVIPNYPSMSSPTVESFQDNKAYCNQYRLSASSSKSSFIQANSASVPTATQAFQHPMKDRVVNKTPDSSYYASSSSAINSYANQNQASYVNQSSFQPKSNMQSSPYTQYSAAQNETYRGSEGPPATQVNASVNMSPASAAKLYSYNSNAANVPGYNYSAQQAASKDVHPPNSYNSQINQQQRTWRPEQNQYSYQAHLGPRMPFSNNLSPSESKQKAENVCLKRTWSSSCDSSQAQDKLQNMSSSSLVQNQSIATSKPQAHPNTITASQAFHSMIKKPMEFPPNTVEAIKPVAVKRRRCPAKRLGSSDPWRIMLALKSGLLAESTWALDLLSILLADNSTVIYFGLKNLPGLLNVLVDHYRCFLNKIFQLADDVEIVYSPSAHNSQNSKDLSHQSGSGVPDWENKLKVLDSPNYTYRTRCKKKVEIQYSESLFLIDPETSWDNFEGFEVSPEHWQKGGGDITSHIQTSFDSCSKKLKFNREIQNSDKNKQKNMKMKLSKSISICKSSKAKASILCKGEPVVVLQKFNFLANKLSFESVPHIKFDDINRRLSLKSSSNRKLELIVKKEESKISMDSSAAVKNIKKENKSDCSISKTFPTNSSPEGVEMKPKLQETENTKENNESSSAKELETSSRLRGSQSSRKRFLCKDLEDEAYYFDEPALCVVSDSQEMLSRRCVCVSTILRNLSFVPGNDVMMSKNPGVLLLLGRLLLLHHEHKPAKNAYRKYEKEIDGNVSWNESCTSLKDDYEWWWGTLSILRDNTLVVLSNISGQLDLAPFPEEISLPILDGLLHWIVCPSSYAQDPLPSRSSSSVLSPQRLSLEALCKLSVLSSNVDLIIATPPWSRIENLLAFLTKSLSCGQDQIMREFAVILLSNISCADSVAARTIAEQSHCISYLISFIEEAEANAFQISVSQGTKKLRDKPELMGTTPGMVQRAASTLKNLALVPENQGLFVRYQSKLLSLVMSQVMDQELQTIIADVLFYCSEGDAPSQIPIS